MLFQDNKDAYKFSNAHLASVWHCLMPTKNK
ncbi:hypothetical protein AB210_2037 [Acinetobacter baumannii AB210]|nr:hypothetical protein AB210_2037 [Acinetobacter baumannii AB210]